jgi:hypothetical protein
MTVQARFWSKVDTRDDCWRWTGTRTTDGYGWFWSGRRNIRAHRVAWEITAGSEIPSGMKVLHSCDDRLCVNPGHLRLGTQRDNLRDCVQRGRHPLAIRDACRQGHPFNEANTYWSDGGRKCRVCDREWRRRARAAA